MNESDVTIIRKRFIAGAVCPECNVADRIVVEYAEIRLAPGELSRRRCVDCGFADPFGSEGAVPAGTGAIPRGKPERPRLVSVVANPVKIIDPKG